MEMNLSQAALLKSIGSKIPDHSVIRMDGTELFDPRTRNYVLQRIKDDYLNKQQIGIYSIVT